MISTPDNTPGPAPHVVIIGGGFSGAMVGLHLARQAAQAVRITIVEHRALLGGGVAYSTPDPQHRINVPASRMSAFSSDMQDFDRWLRHSGLLAGDPDALVPDPLADAGRSPAPQHAFPSRLSFGRYLDETVRGQMATPGPAQLRHLRAAALGLRLLLGGTSPRYAIDTDTDTGAGASLTADILVITTSHPPPAAPARLATALCDDPRLIADPWRGNALADIPPTSRVAIMGSGLTMVDLVASLTAAGHRGPITVFSRHGLLPGAHALDNDRLWGDFADNPAPSARLVLQRIRDAVGEAAGQGIPWQGVLDAVRRDAPALWAALPLVERRRLLRHLRSHWDAHRYRMAVPSQRILEKCRASGRLEVLAASLLDATPGPTSITMRLRPRHTRNDGALTREVDTLLLATGPAHHRLADAVPALAPLLATGRLQADLLGLGIAVDTRARALDAAGRADGTLWVAGPLARGTFGELMGLPHVLIHAEQVAAAIAEHLANA